MGNCKSKQGERDSPSNDLDPPVAPLAAPVEERQDPIDSSAPVHSRAGGYRPSKQALKEHEPVKEGSVEASGIGLPTWADFTVGTRWSIAKLSTQARESIILCAVIFVINESVTASALHYWRPIAWSVIWISITLLLGMLGIASNHTRQVLGLITYLVLQLMFAAINLQHLNMMHSEAVRSCNIPQINYKHCDNPALKHCIQTSQTVGHDGTCTKEELQAVSPACHAPGKEVCLSFEHMDWIFWVNQAVNFFTYAEPSFWAVILLVRLEIAHQHEGPNNSTHRKLVQDHHHSAENDLPEEGTDQPYTWSGAVVMLISGFAIFAMTVYLQVTRAESSGNSANFWFG
jgi:hypothetical protein